MIPISTKLKVTVFVIYEESADFYLSILRRLFEDHIELEVRLYSDLSPLEPFDADIVLFTVNFLKAILAEKCVNPGAVYYHMGNTLQGKNLEAIKQLNRGTELLIVSEGSVFLWDTLLTFKAHGIDHVDFVPYYGQRRDFSAYKYAIYLGIETYELPWIENAIDIGWRVVHPFVLRKIGEAAALSEDYMAEKITAYMADETDLLDYHQCVEISIESEAIQERLALLNQMESPALLINEQEVVLGFNERLRSEFQMDFEKMLGQKIYKSELLESLRRACDDRGGNGRYETAAGRRYSVEIKVIESYGESLQHRFLLKAVPILKDESPTQLTYRFQDIICESQEMKRVVALAKHFAGTEENVLIEGPSGVGKELLAHSIHAASKRRNHPFHAVNCGAFSETLLESELFGYSGGAFTGALRSGKKGLLESANGGTVFLDEIGEASLKLQVRLLCFLQEKEVQPIGSNAVKKVDVRVICATNRDLEEAMALGTFRDDLYYRISPVTLLVPPLRDRLADVEPILAQSLGPGAYHLSEPLKNFFKAYPWPGNVRELKGCAAYMLSFGKRDLTTEDLPDKYQRWLRGVQKDIDSPMTKEILPMVTERQKIEVEILALIDRDHAGRRSLLKTLSDQGFKVTEYKILEILSEMKAQGWIEIKKGRHGTFLTEVGRRRLDALREAQVSTNGCQ
ncbi:sigma-54 interaction domain-containing protein [Acidaminobacter hydrogenoformans]|uniref:Transcriptional regulator containing PAS, AAA-type ATPase, and DNA-binding Fis domains n=1 Tax=Acidaminobacter hydrogenoformans DSM 2784 TaxID=1120920 RepID=A0A1G5S3Y4_9FIRM|nr:sigma 54-interacting transcriptional regulator [Acidaminobacter hydrogenoformans]SCZ81026.1 Transcriptional regulator containing PAS, AAA-type ATPase, and DNA-binding Fis domains [Acidaminobacter hydrogenoformans DSM 2784]